MSSWLSQNILMVGPTGSGKDAAGAHAGEDAGTYRLRSWMRRTLTEAGYVGEDVENIILKLLQAAEGDVTRAQSGIIYIDEIDKIGRKDENPSITRDVLGRGRAAGASEDPRRHCGERSTAGRPQAPAPGVHGCRYDETFSLSAEARLSGWRRLSPGVSARRALGFKTLSEPDAKDGRCDPRSVHSAMRSCCVRRNRRDLLKYGLIPEFVGRLPVMGVLDELDEAALIRDPDQAAQTRS